MSPIRTIHVLCLVLLAWLPGAIVAQEPGEDSRVTLTVQPFLTEILQCEPLGVVMTLRYHGPAVQRPWADWKERVELWCKYGDEEWSLCGLGYPSGGLERAKHVLPIDVKDGTVLHAASAPIFYFPKNHEFVFRKSGYCHLKARIVLDLGTFESDAVAIFVKPVPPSESEALNLIQQAAFVTGMTSDSGFFGIEDGERVAVELITEYPESLFSDHVRYRLGCYYWAERFAYASADNAAYAAKSYAMLSAVSPRIGALRMRALIRMAGLVQYREPEFRNSPEHKRILEELEAYKPLAESMGLEPELAEMWKIATQTPEDREREFQELLKQNRQ